MDNLNDKQLEAAQHGQGPLLIAAGAGSGKTKTLVHRLLHLLESGTPPEKIIAITFTNKAANEMRDRITNNQQPTTNDQNSKSEKSSSVISSQSLVVSPFVGTFHSFGVKILKNEVSSPTGAFGRTKNFTIFDNDDSLSLIKKILREKNLSKDRFNPIAILGKISEIKNELSNAEDSEIKTGYDTKFTQIYEDYENILKKSNAFDFDDLITKVVQLFMKNPEVLEKYQNRYEYVLVDEYQDINTAQYQLIKLLAKKHQNIFAIGDDQQSIYAFRGSDFRNFLNFEKDWPKAKIIKLEQNYRSAPAIVLAASELIKNNKQQKPKKLWTENKEGELIKIIAYQNSEEEAWGICEKIAEQLHNTNKYEHRKIKIETKNQQVKIGEIAILYRTNAQSRALEMALIQNKIPYEIYGGLKFCARKEIKDIVAGLRYAFNPNDSASIERLNKNFTKTKNKILLEKLPELAGELSLAQIINYFLENTGYADYLTKNFKNPSERMENIKELINFASQYEDPHKFLEEIALMSASDGGPKLKKDSIKLMTIHAAKGLEFDNVFLIGCNEGLLPHEQSFFSARGGDDAIEEERRLMYVAMTRARKKLFISFYDLPSRFLGELPGDLIDFSKITSYGERKTDWDDETIYIE